MRLWLMTRQFMGLLTTVMAVVMVAASWGAPGPRAADRVTGALELVMFEANDCPYCRQWHEEIGGAYPRTEEGKRAPLRVVDLHGVRPVDLEGIAGVVFTPTFVLLRDGAEIGRIAGYPGDHFFWPMLAELLKNAGG